MVNERSYIKLVKMNRAQEQHVKQNAARLGIPVATYMLLATTKALKDTFVKPIVEDKVDEDADMVRRQTYTVAVQMTEEQKQYCFENASRLGISVSAFIVLSATGHIQDRGEIVVGKREASYAE